MDTNSIEIIECAICLECNVEQSYNIFKCKHVFHNDCTYHLLLSPYPKVNNLCCPLCRSQIVYNNLEYFLVKYYLSTKFLKLSNIKKLTCYKIQFLFDKMNENVNEYKTSDKLDLIRQNNVLLDERIYNIKTIMTSSICKRFFKNK